MNRLPNNFALIIGAMKCGTTSLFYYLSEHPQISAAKDKESFFFAEDHKYARGLDWYRSLWDWKPEHKIAIEASTGYAMYPRYPNVAERIAQVDNANFRFIYIMRHPFFRIESHIVHLLSDGLLRKPEVVEETLAFSEYAKQLDIYANLFGRDKIHLVCLEDLKQNPQAVLSSICKFLEIDSDYKFLNTGINLNTQKKRNVHPFVRQINRIPVVKFTSSLIPPQVNQKLYNLLSRRKPFEVELSEQEKNKIMNRLEPDLARLKSEYGVDFNANKICS